MAQILKDHIAVNIMLKHIVRPDNSDPGKRTCCVLSRFNEFEFGEIIGCISGVWFGSYDCAMDW